MKVLYLASSIIMIRGHNSRVSLNAIFLITAIQGTSPFMNIWSCKLLKMKTCIPVSKLVHVSAVLCHEHASSRRGCAFVHFIIQYCTEDGAEYLCLKPRMTGSKHKNSSDMAVTAKKHHWVMVKTKVKIIERVKRGMWKVLQSYYSTQLYSQLC